MKRFISSQIILLFVLVLFIASCNKSNGQKNYFVSLETSEGIIKLRLYNNTPGHRDNFLKLVKEKYYNGIKFHRVINEFMIQGGNFNTRPDFDSLLAKKYSYTIPAEINNENFHKKGVLAAARTGDRFNPERKSSGTQFYIVQGVIYENTITAEGDTISGEDKLAGLEKRINTSLQQNIFYKNLQTVKEEAAKTTTSLTNAEITEKATLLTHEALEKFSPFVIPGDHREVYKRIGGTPHLDQQYTVFGEVVEGMEIIDKIAATSTDEDDRPINDIIILKARRLRK